MLLNTPKPKNNGYPLSGLFISNHAVERYEYWRGLLGQPPIPGLTTREEISLIAVLSEPRDIPDTVVKRRLYKHNGVCAEYRKLGAYSIVYDKKTNVVVTVEPNVREDDPGAWRDVEEALGHTALHGFTVEEITGGVIKNAYR